MALIPPIALATITLVLSACVTVVDRSPVFFQETAALKHILELQAAETEFFARNGKIGFLHELGPAGARLIDSKLASGVLGGYRFEIDVATPSMPKCVVRARPLTWGKSGYRSFYSDQSGLVHQSFENAPATAESPAVK